MLIHFNSKMGNESKEPIQLFNSIDVCSRVISSQDICTTSRRKEEATSLNELRYFPKQKQTKSVSFSKLEIREHNIVYGDHPCASSLPISLGWEHSSSIIEVDIDSYENVRADYRRKGDEIRLSQLERKNLLKRVGGLTESDIKDAQRRHNRMRNNEQFPTGLSTKTIESNCAINIPSTNYLPCC
mmetsp:Transcript_29728/g.28587  ORF Transcript_29728/g.28587 Transcript_29728/m.28587 type:complete len:185 (-) Transcript_29728:85-639(-)